jgi:hypothetical protein
MTEVAHVVSQNLVALAGLQIANYRKYRQKSGSNFNVFKILRRTTDEVNGHSSFIAELLNPLGGHGLGDVFLKRFFTTLGISQDIEGLSHWEVFVEEGKDVDGRMDILVVGHDDAGRKIGIAIENKIYAGDQVNLLCSVCLNAHLTGVRKIFLLLNLMRGYTRVLTMLAQLLWRLSHQL